ncbi:hydroxymethylbilane synthase [Brachybacterium tyrofermentans]|uniref:hydroxymethylbilane synthase n=1 Tax=Brachybacterium tyrofermentans TaxID=47848 RepID=UPI003FD588F8
MTAALSALRLGTRASQLALTQSGQVGEALVAGTDHAVELVHVSTHGDVDRTSPLAQIGGTGVFVTAVRQALLDGTVDAIVHSCKDLPTQPLEDIILACIPAREDPRDALCARDGMTLEQLPEGARVGTGSPRRAAQLLRARPDLDVVGIRGNIETRLARALGEEADLDAVVLAASGLLRVGRGDVISELLSVDVMLPAPAQGALAVEATASALTGATPDPAPGTVPGTTPDTAPAPTSDTAPDPAPAWFAERMAAVDDPATRAAVTAERALLRTLEAGCSAPVAAYAEIIDGELSLRALAIRPDGSHVVEGTARVAFDLAEDDASGTASIPFLLGSELAADLIERGAGEILAAAKA